MNSRKTIYYKMITLSNRDRDRERKKGRESTPIDQSDLNKIVQELNKKINTFMRGVHVNI